MQPILCLLINLLLALFVLGVIYWIGTLAAKMFTAPPTYLLQILGAILFLAFIIIAIQLLSGSGSAWHLWRC